MQRIVESGIAGDETVSGGIVMVVAVDPGESAAEIEVEFGRPEGSLEMDGDGVKKGDMIFVNGSDEGCLKREKRK